MSYKEDLGRVKGNKGATLVPIITYTATGIKINWTTSDSEYDGPFPEEVVLEPAYYIPKYNAETGLLEWVNSHEGMPGYESMPEIEPMQIKGDTGATGASEVDIRVIVDRGGYTTPTDIINYYTGNNPSEGIIYVIGEEAFVYDNETGLYYTIEKLVDLSNYYTKSETHERFFTKQEVYDWLANINEIQEAIINLLDNGVINIPIDQSSGEIDYQTLRLIFNEEYSDTPIIYVDGIPWQSYEKTEDYLYLYQVPDGDHIIFYEEGNSYSMLECHIDAYHTEFTMPTVAIKPSYNQTIITTSEGNELYGCSVDFNDIMDSSNDIHYHSTDAYIMVIPIPIGYYTISASKMNYRNTTLESDNEYNTILIRENGRFVFDLEYQPLAVVGW